MTDPIESDPYHLRVLLDHGEVVELDGGTLTVDGEVAGSVLLRLVPWRARTLSRVLEEWSALSKMFNPRVRRPSLNEYELSRTLAAAASASPKISLRRSMTPMASSTEASTLTPMDR